MLPTAPGGLARLAAARLATALSAAALLAGCGGGGAGPPPERARVTLGSAPQRGPADAWVTVVEFSDFQCPYCGLAQASLALLAADYPADVRVVFKHFPLSFHAHAAAAAVAAECARAQEPSPDGRFWAMHDALFATQGSWGASGVGPAAAAAFFADQASQVAGLDEAAWGACVAADDRTRVEADLAQGRDVPVPGTPTFVINGEVLVGAGPPGTFYPVLRDRVDAALATARQSGIPRAEYYDRAVLGP